MKDGRPTLDNYALFKSGGHDDGPSNAAIDFLQSSVQELTDSPKDVLKGAILHHEIMFRKQVLELHRLYWTQKNLMNDLSWRDFDKNVGSRDSQITNQSTEMDFLFADSPAINSTTAESGSIFEECLVHAPQRTYKLELSVEDPIKSAHTEFLGTQNSLYYIADSEELELTLGNKKQGKNDRVGAGKTFYGKESLISTKGWHPFRGFSTCRHTQQSGPTSKSPRCFDLNKKFEEFSKISQDPVNLPSSTSSSTTPVILSGPHINAVATPTSLREPRSKSSEETSDVLQAACRDSASMNSVAKEAEFLTCGYDLHQYRKQNSVERMELDGCVWTRSQNEDDPVTTGCDSESIADPQGKPKEGISGSLPGNDLISAHESPSLSPGLYQLSNEGAQKSLVFPGCCAQNEKSISTISVVNEKGCNSHPSIWSSNLAQKASAYSKIKQSSGEKSEEDTVSSCPCGNLMSLEGAIFVPSGEIQDEHNGSEPTGEKPDHADRKEACSGRNAEIEAHSVHSMGDCSQRSQICLAVTEKYSSRREVVTETDDRIALDEKSCNYSESSDNCREKQEKHEVEIDCPVWKAAESLIHISLPNKASPSDKIASIGQLEMENEELSDEPQDSSDSFELMVLALPQTVNDEYSKPARLCEEEIEKCKCRFKLRNRRVRDFQREVLPGLVSLSRKEICDDLHTLAEAVRLDGLKYGSNKFSGATSSTPMRSRRSRRSYVGKRLYK